MEKIRCWPLAALISLFCCGSNAAGNLPDLPYKYVGNSQSLKFHRLNCPFAQIMQPHKRLWFHFRRQAIAFHYRPCRYCLPPCWKSVSAKILPNRQAPEPSTNPRP